MQSFKVLNHGITASEFICALVTELQTKFSQNRRSQPHKISLFCVCFICPRWVVKREIEKRRLILGKSTAFRQIFADIHKTILAKKYADIRSSRIKN